MKTLLEVKGLNASYGSTPALRDVSITVSQGEIVCIVGQNGAGKSTTLNAVAGGLSPRAITGSIQFDGKEIMGMAPERIARAGINLVPEGRHAFREMTVTENLRIGSFIRADRWKANREIEGIFELFPRLYERRNHPAGLLSGGEQQMLVIGRSVMTDARLMMIDEPSLGLAPKIIEQVYEALLKLRKERGLTLLINEQSSNRVLKYADRFYVLRGGQLRLEGKVSDLKSPDEIRQAYFGVSDSTEVEAKEAAA